MAKFHGPIGYSETKETSPGVWTEVITERDYYGEVIKNTASWQSTENINKDLVISNTISIVADQYANDNFSAMRYVNWMGTSWEIKNINVQRPRLQLMIGGIYNGPKPKIDSTPET